MEDCQVPVLRETPASLSILQKNGSTFSVPLPEGILPADLFVLQQWLTAKRTPATQEAYGHDIGEFYAFQIQQQGKNTLTQMYLFDLQAYAALLIHQELKPSSQARKIACVRSLFRFASRLPYIPINVAALLELPKVDDELAQRILPEQDFHHMIENEQMLRDRVILMMLYYCGLRASEVCSLKWRQFIPRQHDQHFGATVTIHGKGGTRNVPVMHLLWNEIQNLKREMAEHKYPVTLESYVFQADPEQRTHVPTGTQQMHKNTIYKLVKRASRDAGIENTAVSAHWFRHGHATWSQAHGASALLVKDTLGHKSLATTTKYSHIITGDGSGRYL